VRPKVIFGPPLPLGHSSSCEMMDFFLEEKLDEKEVGRVLSSQLPKGFEMRESIALDMNTENLPQICEIRYSLVIKKTGVRTKEEIIDFFKNPEREIRSFKPGERKSFVLGDCLIEISEETHGDDIRIFFGFLQGRKNTPSVSRIFSTLFDFLGSKCEDILEIERISITPKKVTENTHLEIISVPEKE